MHKKFSISPESILAASPLPRGPPTRYPEAQRALTLGDQMTLIIGGGGASYPYTVNPYMVYEPYTLLWFIASLRNLYGVPSGLGL